MRTPTLLLLLLCLLPGPCPADAPLVLVPASRDYDQQHLRVELTRLDIRGGRIEARASLTLQPIGDAGLRLVRLHAVGLQVSKVTLDGKACKHRIIGGELHVDLPRIYRKGEGLTLVVRYAAKPRRGLYFFAPDHAYPRRPLQVWSQGESLDTRHWIPCYDLPDDRLTSELLVSAPPGLQVISNGRLVSTTKGEGGRQVWHWKQERAHVSYLITLVAGRFDELAEEAAGVRIRSLFPPGRTADARRAFSRTGAMMGFFSELLGRYPWPRYDQVVVHDFVYGGMENTAATTLNKRALHDERAALDYSADGLVSHELAHQWFGDLVTCRTFDHIWLNEGFATYMALLWAGKHEGREALEFARWRSLRGVIKSSKIPEKFKFRRGLPAGLDGGPAYSRGSALLHLLRQTLGDAAFFKGVRDYLRERADRSIETEEFRASLEASSGTKLERLFDDWVYHPGVPRLRVFWSWSPERKALLVAATQLQTHHIYALDVPLLLIGPGQRQELRLRLRERDTLITLPMPTEVRDLIVDPRRILPLAVENERGTAQWLALLRERELPLVRLAAVEALAKAGAAARPALIEALRGDPAWQVRRAAAASLAKVGGAEAIKALIAATADEQARVRRAAVEALGRSKSRAAAGALRKALEADRSYFVQAAAARALLALKDEGLFERVVALLPQASYNDHLRANLFDVLAGLGDPRAIPHAARHAVYGEPNSRPVRRAALQCLDKLRKGRPAVERLLLSYLFDPDRRIRRSVLDLVDKGRIAAARPALAELAQKDAREGLRKRAAEVLERLPGATKK